MTAYSRAGKVGTSLSLIACSLVILLISIELKTPYYRDVFFYADAYVVNEIFNSGHIPHLLKQEESTIYWGKINNRIRLPILPVMIASLSIVTGASPSNIYTSTPSFMLTALSVYLFLRCLSLSQITTTMLSVAAGVALPATVYYALSPVNFGATIVYLAIFLLSVVAMRKMDLPQERIQVLAPIAIILLSLFYWYPPQFLKVAAIITLIATLALFSDDYSHLTLLSLIILAVFLFLQIFSIPLPAYEHYIQNSIINLVRSDFSLSQLIPGGQTGNASASRILPFGMYSLYPLPLLLPMALFGGLVAIKQVVLATAHDDRVSVITAAVIWGIAIVTLVIPYLVSSQSWLSGRVLTLALPVMFLGAGIGLEKLKGRVQITYTLAILILVLLSAGMQASSPQMQVQTYQAEVEPTSDWVINYVPEKVISDMKMGAPLAAKGDFSARYPRTSEATKKLFYSHNYCTAVKNPIDTIILYDQMYRTGFYPSGLVYKPMSQDIYTSRITRSQHIYSNGEHHVLNSYIKYCP